MTDRARLVYALLRTMLAWTPSPRSRMGLELAPRGFAGGRDDKGRPLRWLVCQDCLTNDRILPSCETCGGRGEIPDPGPDPYDKGVAKGVFGGAGGDDAKRALRERELELRRLEQQLARPEKKTDEPIIDPLASAVEARDRLYQHGSYAELERQLDRLRLENVLAYEVAMQVAYAPFGEEPIDPVRVVVVQVCELVAVRMDGPVRVPEYVPVSSDAELERLARAGRGALWWGQGDWHRLKRGERNARIVAMHTAGVSTTAIGLRFNLQRRRVQQILAAHSASESVASSGFGA